MQTYFTQVKHYMTDELRKSSTGALTSFSMATNANTRAVGGRVEGDMGKGLRVGFEVFSRDWNAMNYMRKPGMISDQNIIPDVATTATGGFAIYQWKMAEHAQLTTGFVSITSE